MPVWKLPQGAEAPSRSTCNATLTAGHARRGRGAGRRVGRRGLRDRQAQAGRRRRRRRDGRGRSRGGRTGREDPRRRERGVGRQARHGHPEPDRAVRDRARGAAGERACGRWRGSPAASGFRWPPTRRSRPRPTPTAPSSARSCAYATAKLSKVGGVGAARQIARVLPTYLSSALDGPGRDRRGRPRRPGAPRGRQRTRASPTAWRPSASSPRRSPRASASCATASSTCPTAPAWASRSTRTRWPALPRVASALMDPTNRNTALASALVEELARSGVRQAVICPGSRSTPGRARAASRAGDRDDQRRRRALGRVLRAGRGARLAPPGGDRLHVGHRGGEPPPRRRRGERGVGAADRPHLATARPSFAASAPARRSTR